MKFKSWYTISAVFTFKSRQRPHHIGPTSSRQLTEVKQCRAPLVLGRVTAWEYGVLLAFCVSIVLILDMLQYQDLSTGRTTRLYIFFMNYGRITRTGRFRGKAPFTSTVRREFDPRWQRLCIFWYR